MFHGYVCSLEHNRFFKYITWAACYVGSTDVLPSVEAATERGTEEESR